MFSFVLIRIVLTITLSALCVVAQQPAARTEKPATPGAGKIKGRVVNESGQPLPNATVSARVPNGNDGQAVATERDGTFQINDLEQGPAYYVTATVPAYTSPALEPGAQPPTYHAGDSVTLTLIKGGVITGTVTNAAGEPMVAIRVRVERVVRDRNGKRQASGGTWGERQTDDRGVYRIYGLLAGTYVVMAGGPNPYYSSSTVDPYETDVPTYANSATRDTAQEITVRSGEEVSGVDIRYRAEAGRTISGVVTGAGRGFNVMLSTAGSVVVPWNATSYNQMENNTFSFLGLAEGDYDLFAYSYSDHSEIGVSDVKRISLRGADATGIELTTRPLGSISGKVVLDETKSPECVDKSRASFSDMTVGAWHNDTGDAKETPQMLWAMGVPVKPNAEGNFLIRNLAAGQYFFGVRSPSKNWYLRSIQFAPADARKKPVDVTRTWTSVKNGEQLSGLTFTLAHGAAALRGQLALGEGEKVPPRSFVYLVPVERERVENPLSYFGTPVDAEGKLGWNNLEPGRYWVLAETIGEDEVIPLSRIRFPDETDTRAQIRRAAETAKTEIVLKPCQEVVDFKVSLKGRDSQ